MQDLVALTTGKLEPIVDTRYVCVVHGIIDNFSPNPDDPAADISKIEATIDQLIYNLYDVTPDEIAIVEGK